jgi:hypothetical protein
MASTSVRTIDDLPTFYSIHRSDGSVVVNQLINKQSGTSVSVVSSDILRNYVSLIKLTNIGGGEFSLINNSNYSDSISTRTNKNVNIGNLVKSRQSTGEINTPKPEFLDETIWDLMVSDITLILNLSKEFIYVKRQDGTVRMFRPIKCVNLEHLEGSVLFLTTKIFDSVEEIRARTSIHNYLNDFIKDNEYRHIKRVQHSVDIFNEIKRAIVNDGLIADPDGRGHPGKYKVTLMHKLDISEFDKRGTGTEVTNNLYLSYYNLLVSLNSHNNIPDNPGTSLLDAENKEIDNITKDHSFVCFIVDKENTINTRYHNVGGKVFPIKKVTNTFLKDGLYYKAGKVEDINETNRTPLEEINNLKYIYKTREEAENGLKLSEMKKMELEEKVLDVGMTKLEHERQINEVAREHELRKLEAQKESLQAELEKIKADKFKAAAEIEKTTNKAASDKIGLYATIITSVVSVSLLIGKALL